MPSAPEIEESVILYFRHRVLSFNSRRSFRSRLKKCVSKYLCLREEMVELREAHDTERREQEALQAALVGGLRRRLLLADSFVPHAGRAHVARLAYDEDQDAWARPARDRWAHGAARAGCGMRHSDGRAVPSSAFP